MKVHRGYDVIVTGGGPAGIGAAVAAARNGARTLLIEQAPFLGGCLAMDLAFLTFHNQRGIQILNGIAQELVDRVKQLGGSPGHADTLGANMRTFTAMEPEITKYMAQEMVLEAEGEMLLRALASDAVMEGRRMTGVVIHGKSGTEIISGEVVIDCSGDADIAARAGVPFEKGRPEDGGMQATTLMFRMANVDTERMPENWDMGLTRIVRPGESKPSFLRAEGHFDKWAEAWKKEGMFDQPHHYLSVAATRPGELKVNTARIAGVDATDTWSISQAEIEGRRQVMAVHRFMKKHIPGFEKSVIVATGPFLGVRETRRIKGDYELTADDVLQGVDFPDNIGRGAFPIDIHDPKGKGIHQRMIKGGRSYGIPYRIMLPNGVDQLLVAGRCVSATHDALGAVRVMGPAIAMGQAAGTAAALAVRQGTTVREVDIDELRAILKEQSAVLEEEDSPGRLQNPPGFKVFEGETNL